jgi:hypothetical protein
MNPEFRASGPMEWLLEKFSSVSTWSLIGTISPEERSSAVLSKMNEIGRLANGEFIRIEPAQHYQPNRFRESFAKKLKVRERKARRIAGSTLRVRSREVLCREDDLIAVGRDSLASCSKNLIIDISAMPKRFFFPVITLAMESENYDNIIVTYASPERYGDTLAEDPLPWKAFPMFGEGTLEVSKARKLLIAVGYQPLSLKDILDGVRFNAGNVELLLPFPSVYPGFIKNWRFVRQIRDELPELRGASIKRVPTRDASLAYDRIVAITNGGKTPSVLAPYGPKPLSLAMCLYGIACRARRIPVEIGYTQPQVYSDKYSVGVGSINAYCIRINGRSLYQL